MEIISVCGLIMVLAHYSFAEKVCDFDLNYESIFVPDCLDNDKLIKWPYYQNFTKYYVCIGTKQYSLESCPYGKYFSYILQGCTDCNKFIPAPKCEHLKTSGKPNCTQSQSTMPTTVSPTPKDTTKPSLEVPTPSSENSSTPGISASKDTNPIINPSIPTAPVIVTAAPGVPTPPVEPPTPPTINENPPIVPF